MAAPLVPAGETSSRSDPGKSLDLSQYPTPLSPPYPELSREVELRRAMSAASKSSLFTLSDTDIVFQDEWLVVVNKPAGIYCETLLSSYTSSLPPDDNATAPELHLANRLDRDTSGLMIITKSHKVAAKLVKAFTDHKVSKTYIALCVGRAPQWQSVRVISGHGRSRHGAWRVYAASDVGRTLPGGSVVKHMDTSFQVLSINGNGSFQEPAETVTNGTLETVVVEEKASMGMDREEKMDEILARAYPRSGRTHQIRLHCQHLGMSIRGDVKYGGVDYWKGDICEAHDLHAESLSFDHPVTGVRVRYHAPLPAWVRVACQGKAAGS